MKYRLKQDYNYIKSGTISEEWRDHAFNILYVFKFVFKNRKIEIVFNKEEINDLLQRDIVEKLPEPKWTDEDMIKFCMRILEEYKIKLDLSTKYYIRLELLEYEKQTE